MQEQEMELVISVPVSPNLQLYLFNCQTFYSSYRKEQKLGLINQEKIDKVLGSPFGRQSYEDEKYLHEADVRLVWVDDFEQIRPFIDLSYKLR